MIYACICASVYAYKMMQHRGKIFQKSIDKLEHWLDSDMMYYL